MKKLKYLFVVMFLFVFAFGLFKVASVNEPEQSASGDVIATRPILDYVSLSVYGQNLGYNNLKAVNNSSYLVFSNQNVTIKFMPLRYNYGLNGFNQSAHFKRVETSIEIPKVEGTSANSFEYDGTTFYFRIITGTSLNIYETNPSSGASVSPLINSERSDLISFTDTDEKITINVTESFTYVVDESNEQIPFNFSVYSSLNSNSPLALSLLFQSPKINFANAGTPIVEFERFSNGWADPETDYWIKPETDYNYVHLKFLNGTLGYNYTEDAPLYFNINFNGFTYKFELYIADDCLFVNYTDETDSNNNTNLASSYIASGSFNPDGSPNYIIDDLTKVEKSQDFTLNFKYRGRYSLEIYDDTYFLDMASPNYYQTTFYIQNNDGEVDSLFNNIYIVSRAEYDEEIPAADPEGEPTYNHHSEYIVNTSTQNHSVFTTIKNLYNADSQKPLKDIVKYVVISQTLYGSSDNITSWDYYLPSGSKYLEEVQAIKASSSEQVNIHEDLETDDYLQPNGDFEFFSERDGYYIVTVYKTPENEEDENSSPRTVYSFTIVTQPKSTFTIDGVTHEADADFKTVIESYQKSISNQDPLRVTTKTLDTSESSEHQLRKTYVNSYSVTYGRQKVSIASNIEKNVLTVTVMGVGDLVVEVTFNDETITYNLNSEKNDNILTFSDFGTYTVKITDAMGTSDIQVFTLKKSLNASSIVLIAVSALILTVIAVFVILSRSRLKTR